MSGPDLLRVEDLSVRFGRGARAVPVLHGIDLRVRTGRTVGLVGESGSGKSTLARTILGAIRPAAGRVLLDGRDTAGLGRRERRRMQLVPQDPYFSLNPRRTVAQTLAEALDPARARVRAHRAAIVEALAEVALPADAADRYPHQFSGGQRQRIAIARALVTRPDLVVADEITSALDVSVQAGVLDLLDRLHAERGLTVLFISHDLAVIEQVCDDVAVLHHGRLVETGPVAEVFADPVAEHTRALLTAVPGRRRAAAGSAG
ncbi:hypothetical protein GCM10009613_51230 [Pseudonocardia kongjuensis]|uniref:ABC transporter domain-containing protein n=1 Tax=Pseudonocardia kongjuensis TaxID=102227 RepID=A0ABN1Y4P6_9PSEU